MFDVRCTRLLSIWAKKNDIFVHRTSNIVHPLPPQYLGKKRTIFSYIVHPTSYILHPSVFVQKRTIFSYIVHPTSYILYPLSIWAKKNDIFVHRTSEIVHPLPPQYLGKKERYFRTSYIRNRTSLTPSVFGQKRTIFSYIVHPKSYILDPLSILSKNR
jgi:hypothetical protein